MELIEQYEHLPAVIVLRNCSDRYALCSERCKRLIKRIMDYAKKKGITITRFSRADIRQCFAVHGARNKGEIARAIAKRLPEFSPHVPEMRKLWQSEAYGMGVFDALALVFTYYASEHLGGSY